MSSDRLHQTCKLLIPFLVVFASAVLNILSKDRSSVRPAIDSRITFCQGPLIIYNSYGNIHFKLGAPNMACFGGFRNFKGLSRSMTERNELCKFFFFNRSLVLLPERTSPHPTNVINPRRESINQVSFFSVQDGI